MTGFYLNGRSVCVPIYFRYFCLRNFLFYRLILISCHYWSWQRYISFFGEYFCPTKLLRSFLGTTLSSSSDTSASRFISKLSLLFIENWTEKNRVAVVKSIRTTANRKRRVIVLTSVRKRELMTLGEERMETLEKITRDRQEYATELQLF